MWFKNLRLYALTSPFTLSQEALEAQLAQQAFRPCASFERSRLGWDTPIPQEGPGVVAQGEEGEEAAEAAPPMFTHVVGDYIMLCARKQERLLPASVIRETTEEKVAELEARQARKVYRKERREIQDDVAATLLPRAFTRSQQIFAYIAVKENLLVVNAASAPRAEEFMTLLRDTLGSFPVAMVNSKRAPSDVMTRWLKEQKCSDSFRLDEDVELYNPLDGSNVVRAKNQDLVSDEISVHLDAGKQVKSLGVSWNQRLNCIVHDDLSIKRLRFDDVKEEAESFDEESAAQKFDQEFVLMTLELSGFFEALFAAFGGLDISTKEQKPAA